MFISHDFQCDPFFFSSSYFQFVLSLDEINDSVCGGVNAYILSFRSSQPTEKERDLYAFTQNATDLGKQKKKLRHGCKANEKAQIIYEHYLNWKQKMDKRTNVRIKKKPEVKVICCKKKVSHRLQF